MKIGGAGMIYSQVVRTRMKDKEGRGVIYRANQRQKPVLWCQLRHKCSNLFSNCSATAGMTNVSVNWLKVDWLKRTGAAVAVSPLPATVEGGNEA